MVKIEDLRKIIQSKYQLAIVAARRAKQINNGSLPLVETDNLKPVLIALEELAQNKVPFNIIEPKLKKKKKTKPKTKTKKK